MAVKRAHWSGQALGLATGCKIISWSLSQAVWKPRGLAVPLCLRAPAPASTHVCCGAFDQVKKAHHRIERAAHLAGGCRDHIVGAAARSPQQRPCCLPEHVRPNQVLPSSEN